MIERSIKGKFLVFSVFFLGIVSGVLLTNLWETRVNSAVISADRKSADADVAADHAVDVDLTFAGDAAFDRDVLADHRNRSGLAHGDRLDRLRRQNGARGRLRSRLTRLAEHIHQPSGTDRGFAACRSPRSVPAT